jgi:hypothetical protein
VRDELAKMRADISSRQKNRLKELAVPALDKFGQDRVEAYDALKGRHRADRAELRHDQAAGERRQDVLGGLSANKNEGAALTPVQVVAYLAHARQIAAQHARFNQAGGEITRTADRAPDDPRRRDEDRARDPLEDKRARTEQTARHSEQSGRKQEENERARQRAWVDAIIETRRQDREREGGRER